jgi:hypothetical protein
VRFVQGIDYGPRKGTLGLSFHMAEGGDGTLGFLARHPGESLAEWVDRTNGVSCHALLLTTGEIVQMLDWDHSSGNLNPSDRTGDNGYYAHRHLEDVLGSHWPDPNAYTISMEICGWRGGGAPVPKGVIPGPNDAQKDAAVEWGRLMRRRFPTLRGAVGHHDQSPKACPGLTPNMKLIFTGVGGHGLWPKEENMPGVRWAFSDEAVTGWLTVQGAGHSYLNLSDGTLHQIAAGAQKRAIPAVLIDRGISGPADTRKRGYVINTEAAFMIEEDVAFTKDVPPTEPHDVTVDGTPYVPAP